MTFFVTHLPLPLKLAPSAYKIVMQPTERSFVLFLNNHCKVLANKFFLRVPINATISCIDTDVISMTVGNANADRNTINGGGNDVAVSFCRILNTFQSLSALLACMHIRCVKD